MPGAVVETMVEHLCVAVVAKKSDGKDVRLAFSQPFFVGFSS